MTDDKKPDQWGCTCTHGDQSRGHLAPCPKPKPASAGREFWIIRKPNDDSIFKEPNLEAYPGYEKVKVIEISALAEAEALIENLDADRSVFAEVNKKLTIQVNELKAAIAADGGVAIRAFEIYRLETQLTALQEKLAVAEREHYENQQLLFAANKRIAELADKQLESAEKYNAAADKLVAALAEVERYERLLLWLRNGIEHFTSDDDQSQVAHLIMAIDQALKGGVDA